MSPRTARSARMLSRLPALLLVAAVRGYQVLVSPLLGPTCRYYPSCSAYAVQALRTHGALRGTGLAAWRLARCHPWSPGGVDHVPPRQPHTRPPTTGDGSPTVSAPTA